MSAAAVEVRPGSAAGPPGRRPSGNAAPSLFGAEVIGRRLEMQRRRGWEAARILSHDAERGLHRLRFAAGGGEEWLRLTDASFRWLNKPASDAASNPTWRGGPTGEAAVGRRVRVYWTVMRKWYKGYVESYSAKPDAHRVHYRDGDTLEHVLRHEACVFVADGGDEGDAAGAPSPGAAAAAAAGALSPAKAKKKAAAAAAAAAAQRPQKPQKAEKPRPASANRPRAASADKARPASASAAPSNKPKLADRPRPASAERPRAADKPRAASANRPAVRDKPRPAARSASAGARPASANRPPRPQARPAGRGDALPPSASSSRVAPSPSPATDEGGRASTSGKARGPAAAALPAAAAAAAGESSGAAHHGGGLHLPTASHLAQPQTPDPGTGPPAEGGGRGGAAVAARPSPPTGARPQPKRVAADAGADGPDTKRTKRPAGARPRKLAAALASAPPRGGGPEPRSALVGCRVGIWWDGDKTYFRGTLCAYNPASGRFQVTYDDGQKEWSALEAETFHWYSPRGRSGGYRPALHAHMASLGARMIRDAPVERREGGRPPAAAPALDAAAVGWNLGIHWGADDKFYDAHVINWDAPSRRHHVLYADGEDEWLDLSAESLAWRGRPEGKQLHVGMRTGAFSPRPRAPAPAPARAAAAPAGSPGKGLAALPSALASR